MAQRINGFEASLFLRKLGMREEWSDVDQSEYEYKHSMSILSYYIKVPVNINISLVFRSISDLFPLKPIEY